MGIGITTIKDWKKNRKDLEAYTITVGNDRAIKTRKALKKPTLDLLDDAVWVWFCQERREGTPLSGPIVKEKAILLHKKLGGEEAEFTASEGWLWRWKNRHGVR